MLVLAGPVALAAPADGRCDASAFAGGEGTPASPFQVHTAAALDEVRDCLDRHFRQVAAIDLSSYENWNPIGALPEGHAAWDPRAPRFTGVYDGGGFRITRLAIARPASDQALFGRAGPATFVNVHVEGRVSGTQRVGLLLGGITAMAGQKVVVRDCSAAGVVESAGFAGGLVGDLRHVDLSGSVDRADVRRAASAPSGGATAAGGMPAAGVVAGSGAAATRPVMGPPGHADAQGLPGHYSGCGCH